MLSTRATAAIEQLFERSILENIDPQRHGSCRVVSGEGPESHKPEDERRLVSVGISSYLFRIVALFDFGTDPATLCHLQNQSSQALSGQMLADVYAELANMICGNVNRTLARVFRHSGMSTPTFLETGCSQFVGLLHPDLHLGFIVSTPEGMRFHLSVAASANQDVDFEIEEEAQEEQCAGELEFF